MINTKPIEFARQLEQLLTTNQEMTLLQLAEGLRKSVPWIRDKLSLLRLIPEAQVLVDEGTITMKNGVLLSKIEPTRQGDYITAASFMSYREFKDYCILLKR